MKEGEAGEEAKIIYQQENEFSENLKRIQKRDRLFYPLIALFLVIVVTALNIYFRNITAPRKIVLYYALVSILPVAVYFGLRYAHGMYPRSIYYSTAGIRWVTRRGKEVFVPWADIIKVSPIGDYGRIMGFGNGKVTDYGIYYRKRVMGFKIVSAEAFSEEVGRKIEEYLREFREKSSNSLNGGRNKYV